MAKWRIKSSAENVTNHTAWILIGNRKKWKIYMSSKYFGAKKVLKRNNRGRFKWSMHTNPKLTEKFPHFEVEMLVKLRPVTFPKLTENYFISATRQYSLFNRNLWLIINNLLMPIVHKIVNIILFIKE